MNYFCYSKFLDWLQVYGLNVYIFQFVTFIIFIIAYISEFAYLFMSHFTLTVNVKKNYLCKTNKSPNVKILC